MEKLHQIELVFLSLIYLSGFQISFIAFNTRSWGRVIFGGGWISKFGTICEKHSLKIFTSSLSSDTTFSFSINVILSILKFYQLSMVLLFSRIAYYLYTSNIRLLKKSLLVFRSSLTQIFRCFLYARCDNIVISCLNLFKNLDLVMIALHKLLFINAASLHGYT